jgi:predicted transcriptional regulator of viral defense system
MYGDNKHMAIEQFFYNHPVFRREEFAAWKNQTHTVKEASVASALRYYVKTGKIITIRRNLYGVIPPNQSADSLTIDPFLIAAKATTDAIIGYHSALELLGVAYSSFGKFTYITEQKSKPFEFHGQWFQSVSPPIALQKNATTASSINIINRQGLNLRITNSARTFVDVLDRIELCGGWEEVYRSITNIAIVNIDEIIEYCLMLNNSCLAAKVGYFLSLRQGALSIGYEKLQPLLNAKPDNPIYASKHNREKFQLVKQWNLLLPESVINQTWEEPYADL